MADFGSQIFGVGGPDGIAMYFSCQATEINNDSLEVLIKMFSTIKSIIK